MSDDLVYEAYRQIIYEVMRSFSGETDNSRLAYLGEYDPRRGRFRIYFGCRRSNRQSESTINLQRPDYISAPIPFTFKPKLPIQNTFNMPNLPIDIPGQNPINKNPDKLNLPPYLPQPKIIVPKIDGLPNHPGIRPGGKIPNNPFVPDKIVRPKYTPIFISEKLDEDYWPIIEWEIETIETPTCHVLQARKYLARESGVEISEYDYEGVLEETKNLGRAVYAGFEYKLKKKGEGYIYIRFLAESASHYASFFAYFTHGKKSRFQEISSSYWSRVWKALRSPARLLFHFRIDEVEIGLTEGLLCKKLNKYEPGTMSRSPMGDSYFLERKNPSFRITPGVRKFTINLYSSLDDAKENRPIDRIIDATGFFVCEKDYGDEALRLNRIREDFSRFKKPEELLSKRTFFGDRAELPFHKEIMEEELNSFLPQIGLTSVKGITPKALDIMGIVRGFWSPPNIATAIYFRTLKMEDTVYGRYGAIDPSNWIEIKIDCRRELKIDLKHRSQAFDPEKVPGLMDLISSVSDTMYPILQSGIISGKINSETAIITGYARCVIRDPDNYVTVIIPKTKYKELIKKWMFGEVPTSINNYLCLAFYNSFIGRIYPGGGLFLLSKSLPSGDAQAQVIKIPDKASKLYFETGAGAKIVNFNQDLYAEAFG